LSFDRVADEYDAVRGGEERGAHIAADLAPQLTRRGPVLEVGVGTGVVARALQGAGHRVLGVDIAAAMLHRAQRRIGPRVVRADAACLPFPDAAFGDAVAVWVMHAVADREAVLREVARVLRPGGRFVVCNNRSPEPDALTEIVDPLLGQLEACAQRRHDPEVLAMLADTNGFISHGTFLGAPLAFTEVPAEVADAMARRSHSALWSVPDDQWRDVVEPAIARVRGLGPEPLKRVKRERLLVLERR